MTGSKKQYKSATTYVLAALIPYSVPNMKLSFRPRLFFLELSKISGYQEKTLRTAMQRAKSKGLVNISREVPALTEEGKHVLEPFQAKVLGNKARLMVIFDVPEEKAWARRQLRTSLRAWHFEQIQLSVWVSPYDHKKLVKRLVRELDLGQAVRIYECAEI